jgi:A-kinase anchor protein 13
MYELKVQNPKDKNVWIQSIRAAVLDCPADDTRNEDTLTADQKQRHIDEKQAYIRDLICKSIKLVLKNYVKMSFYCFNSFLSHKL